MSRTATWKNSPTASPKSAVSRAPAAVESPQRVRRHLGGEEYEPRALLLAERGELRVEVIGLPGVQKADRQFDAVLAALALHAADHLHEEGVFVDEAAVGAVNDQAHVVGGAGRLLFLAVAHLPRDGENFLLDRIADAAPVVQRVADGRQRHAGPRRDVPHRDLHGVNPFDGQSC